MTSTSPPAGPLSASRLRALDGLRGIAAAVVVLHHSALLDPGVSDVYLRPSNPVVTGSFAAIVTRTPLQLLFSGQEAVLIFFVLSGLVVALPALRRDRFDWLAYYPRRLVRLLVPVIGSVILAALIIAITSHSPSTATSEWAASSSFGAVDWTDVVRNMDVLISDASYNNPLWSLRYELLFSILLPLYVVGASLAGRWWWAVVLGAGIVMGAGLVLLNVDWIYLPIFLLGTLMAVRLSDLRTWSESIPNGSRMALGVAVLVVGIVLLEARWELAPLRPGSATLISIGRLLSAFGAASIVLVAVIWKPFARFLELRLVQWLGRISFSLYLVHVPILIATSWLLRALPWYWTPVVAIPVALLVAMLFARFVERPSHRLAQHVGGTITRRLSVQESPAAPEGVA